MLSNLCWDFIPMGLLPLYEVGTALIAPSFCDAVHPSNMLPLFFSLCQHWPSWLHTMHPWRKPADLVESQSQISGGMRNR